MARGQSGIFFVKIYENHDNGYGRHGNTPTVSRGSRSVAPSVTRSVAQSVAQS